MTIVPVTPHEDGTYSELIVQSDADHYKNVLTDDAGVTGNYRSGTPPGVMFYDTYKFVAPAHTYKIILHTMVTNWGTGTGKIALVSYDGSLDVGPEVDFPTSWTDITREFTGEFEGEYEFGLGIKAVSGGTHFCTYMYAEVYFAYQGGGGSGGKCLFDADPCDRGMGCGECSRSKRNVLVRGVSDD